VERFRQKLVAAASGVVIVKDVHDHHFLGSVGSRDFLDCWPDLVGGTSDNPAAHWQRLRRNSFGFQKFLRAFNRGNRDRPAAKQQNGHHAHT
jgi:hypothetical protein